MVLFFSLNINLIYKKCIKDVIIIIGGYNENHIKTFKVRVME